MGLSTAGSIIYTILSVCILVLLARIILDWVILLARSWRPSGFVAVLCEGIYTLTDPPLRFVRRFLPPLRIGGAALDLSPIVVFLAIYILQAIVSRTMIA